MQLIKIENAGHEQLNMMDGREIVGEKSTVVTEVTLQ